jgi:predicted DsbA family dithiol-disulfide isomerase
MHNGQDSALNKTKNPSAADRILVTYYTDPLCCWSWALQPHWKRLTEQYSHLIKWKYIMCGMIQDWNTYNDPMNSVNKPLQLGPVWMHASQISGVPMNYSIWHTDPPASSFPSCLAVKCAALQSETAAELLLMKLREAVMTKGLNIAKTSVILSVAKELSVENRDRLDYKIFEESWNNDAAVDSFRNDLQQTRFLKIGRYPTLTFTRDNAKGIMITGYRPYDVLVDALSQVTNIHPPPSEKLSDQKETGVLKK